MLGRLLFPTIMPTSIFSAEPGSWFCVLAAGYEFSPFWLGTIAHHLFGTFVIALPDIIGPSNNPNL
jgi:hypothetical protein